MKYTLLIDNMTFSYSRLTSFEQCHYGWLLNYIFHEQKQSGYFAEYGSFIHDIIAKILTGEISKEDAPTYYMKHFYESVTTPAMSSSIWAKYYTLGLKYLRSFDFPHRDIIAVEERVRFDLDDGVPFIGYVDVISREQGKLVITDHKSHDLQPFSKKYPEKKTKTDLELELYLRQLILYAYGVKLKYGEYPAVLEFNCFKTGTWITVPFNEDWVEPTLQWARDLHNAIRNETDWKPNEDYFFCHNLCDVRGSCEYVNI